MTYPQEEENLASSELEEIQAGQIWYKWFGASKAINTEMYTNKLELCCILIIDGEESSDTITYITLTKNTILLQMFTQGVIVTRKNYNLFQMRFQLLDESVDLTK